MKHNRISVLFGAGAMLLAAAASAQERMAGSGIKVTKDGGEVALQPNTTPASTALSGSASSPALTFTTPFDISAYGALSEKNITYLMATGDSLEIEIGNIAQSKGTDQRVRNYGTMLTTDHTAHLAKTWEIITDENVGVESIANDNESMRLRELLTWLRNNPASPAWDATLLRAQAQHHQNVIDILNGNIKNAHDDDLEDHIEKSLASLAKHRDSAKSIGTHLGLTIP